MGCCVPKPHCVRWCLCPISCGPSSQSCPSDSSTFILLAEEGRRYADDTVSFILVSGWLVACASSMPATRAGPAPARSPSRTRMDTPPPGQMQAVPWCWNPGGLEPVASGWGHLHTQRANNTFLSYNITLSAKRFARVRPAALQRNFCRKGRGFSSTSPFSTDTVRMAVLTARQRVPPDLVML
ncbi:ribonuclease HI [Trypanosoma cruzi]|nr:ribonuclease HI [Trypanosoma cruzi]